MIIKNASSIPLNQNSGTLPDMRNPLLDWFQYVQFITINKVIVNFEVYEIWTQNAFQGVLQPFTTKQLQIKPEGERDWSWFTIHATPDLELSNDDIIYIDNTAYRVMGLLDYSKYGYIEYHAIQDYQDNPHAPPLPNEDTLAKFVHDYDVTDTLVFDVDVSANVPDARNAIWGLFDTSGKCIGAVQVISATQVQVSAPGPGHYRLIGAS